MLSIFGLEESFVDILSLQFLYALGAIVLIDLVLAGDNAIVIALAARRLPPNLQKRAIMWGTVGAIAVRTLMTVVVVWLLKVPGLLLLGGALLLWIAVKLLAPQEAPGEGEHGAANSFWGAMKTIVVADAVMGLDNVLAVAGAAHGNFLLVVLGLLISIPIVVWGSTLILKWVERFPIIIYAGAAVLAWIAAKMMLGEPLVKEFIEPVAGYAWLAQVLAIAGVLGIGYMMNLRNRTAPELGTESTVGSVPALCPVPSIDTAAAPVLAAAASPLTALATPAGAIASAVSLKEIAVMNHAPALSVADVSGVAAVSESAKAGSGYSIYAQPALSAMPSVLLPVNDSPSALAAVSRFISSTPRGTQLQVHVAHVVPGMHRHITRHLPAGSVARFGAARAAALTPAMRMLEVAGFQAQAHVINGRDTVKALLGLAQQLGVHRIVVGTTAKSGLVRALTNSVTARLLERAPVPIEVVVSGSSPWYVRFGVPAGFGALIAALAID